MNPADQDACPFGRLHHIGIVVEPSRYADTIANLCALLGGEVTESGEDEPLDMRWAFVASAGNPPIEVAAPRGNRPTSLVRYLERRGGGLHHVSFETFDLGAAALHIDAVGLPPVGRDDDHGGYAEVFVHPKSLGGALFHVLEDRRG